MTWKIEVISLNVSREKGTAKSPVPEVVVDEFGIVGDAHAGRWHRQVSLLAQEDIDRFALQVGRPIEPGEFGENITFRGSPQYRFSPLDRVRFGLVELEVAQIGKECHGSQCAIFQQIGKCVMPAEGLFARVLRGGTIEKGDVGECLPRPLRCRIITLSDRAAAGSYADRSGPRIREMLDAHFAERRWHYACEATILPDDSQRLRREIISARESGVDVLITAGGTGVGPRDIAPDTIVPLCDKLIPGIVEHIRAKFGRANPRARLSRSVAGTMGTMQIYALPGSVRAAEEYVPEILETLEHLIYMLHGIDVH
jgi:molybdopterin adenylyltransferase